MKPIALVLMLVSGCGWKYVEEMPEPEPVPVVVATDSAYVNEPEEQSRLRGTVDGRAAVQSSVIMLSALAPVAGWFIGDLLTDDKDNPLTRENMGSRVALDVVLFGGGMTLLSQFSRFGLDKKTTQRIESQPTAYQAAYRQAYEQEYRQKGLIGSLVGTAALGLTAYLIYDGRINQ